MSDPIPPPLPDTAPIELRDFVACRRMSVTISSGKLDWLPIPPDSGLPVPEITLEPGASPGTGTITVTMGFFSFPVGVSIVDGQLQIDTSGLPSLLSEAATPLTDWVKQLNDLLQANRRRLKPAIIRNGSVTLEKEPIPPVAPPAQPAKPGDGEAKPPAARPPVPPPPAEQPKRGEAGGWCSLLLIGLIGVIVIGVGAVATGVITMPGGTSAGPASPGSGPAASSAPPSGVATPSAAASVLPSSAPSSAPAPSTGPNDDARLARLYDLGIYGEGAWTGAWFSDPEGDLTHVAPGQPPTMTNAETDTIEYAFDVVRLDAETAGRIHALAACGDLSGVVRMLCNRTDALPPGEYVLVLVQLGGPLPDPPFPAANLWSWAAVFGDGDPTTGAEGGGNVFTTGAEVYVEAIHFRNQQGVDQGYVLATDERKPARSDTGEVHGNLPTHARFIAWSEDGLLVALIPAAEVAGLTTRWTGNFVQQRGGPGIGIDRTDEEPVAGD